jgi:phosphoenolpyruvate carboxylase
MNTLTSAQKAARTRFDNKAFEKINKATDKADKEYAELVDALCPKRDAIIDKIKAERDALIAEITQKYQVQIDVVVDEYNKIFDPVNDKRNQQFSVAFKIYQKEMAEFDARQNND